MRHGLCGTGRWTVGAGTRLRDSEQPVLDRRSSRRRRVPRRPARAEVIRAVAARGVYIYGTDYAACSLMRPGRCGHRRRAAAGGGEGESVCVCVFQNMCVYNCVKSSGSDGAATCATRNSTSARRPMQNTRAGNLSLSLRSRGRREEGRREYEDKRREGRPGRRVDGPYVC